MGRTAADGLIDRIEAARESGRAAAAPIQRVLSAELVVRSSCAPPNLEKRGCPCPMHCALGSWAAGRSRGRTWPTWPSPSSAGRTPSRTCASRAAELYLGRFGGAYATDDVDRLLADPDVDVVVVATPDKLHAEHALAVLAAGKHLFLEKPMATTVSDALRVAAAAARSPGQFMVDFKFRFAHAAAAAREFVPRPLVLFGQAVGDPEPPGHWRLDPALSAGVLYDLGPHLYDLLYWLAGEAEPVRVYAEGGALQRPGSPLVDNLIATFKYANEARATAIVGNSGQSGFASKWMVESFGGDRNATIHDHAQSLTLREAGGQAARPTCRRPARPAATSRSRSSRSCARSRAAAARRSARSTGCA